MDDQRGFVARGASVRKEASALEGGGGMWLNCQALDAALGVHERLGDVLPTIHRLQRVLRAGLRQRGFVPNAPDDESSASGICVVPVEGAPEDAVRALLKERVVTTARGGGLRISTHAYNTEEDLERLLSAIDRTRVRPTNT